MQRLNIKIIITTLIALIVYMTFVPTYGMQENQGSGSSNSSGSSDNSSDDGTSDVGKMKSSWQEKKEDIQDKKNQFQEQREEKVQNRCANITNKVDQKIGNFNENKITRIERYYNLKTRISNLIDKLEDQGYDVDQLKTDLQTLDDMIEEFATTYADFISSLEDTKDFECGNSGYRRNILR